LEFDDSGGNDACKAFVKFVKRKSAEKAKTLLSGKLFKGFFKVCFMILVK
jgi:hypothetical protein